MQPTIRSLFAMTLFAASGAGANAQPLPAIPAGVPIYEGAVFTLRSPGSTPLFRYERRVADTASGLTAAHVTRDPEGDVIIVESARVTPAYALERFDASNRQLGYSGSVVVSPDGRHLQYRLEQHGKVTTANEEVRDPVVSGPSLHGFILAQWDTLAAGQAVPVRMIVMTKLQTYGFEIRRAAQADGRTTFSITPSSLLVRLAVPPLAVVFDTTTHHVVRYEGRVPPMQTVGGKLRDLDARVDYTMAVSAYR
jgi:hypothetical protein